MRTRQAHHSIRPGRRIRPVVIAAAVCSTLVAACGSSSPSTTGASGHAGNQPSTAQVEQQLAAFTGCMRAHGVAGLANLDQAALKGMFAPGTQHSPAFLAAMPECAHLLPGGGPNVVVEPRHSPAQIAAALAFARCIRSHGFPSFPDPNSAGQLTHEMVAAAGINVHQPAVLQAGDACAPVTHGFITKAIVAHFVHGN